MMLSVSEELFGPPSVIAQIISKVLAASIILTDNAVNKTGLITGSLIANTCCSKLAPSILAASSILESSPCNPANIINIINGVVSQISAMQHASNDHFSSASQRISLLLDKIPIFASNSLTIPKLELIINFHVRPATNGAIIRGAIINERIILLPL